ncbi:hypothetical protein BDW74DRAFT_163956 [Aspergillus multicolor]|uniref:uncharacterized protein n=1 Tax=Aspergillus multicolor TaxID=41759 RepID=UPI003CCD66BD
MIWRTVTRTLRSPSAKASRSSATSGAARVRLLMHVVPYVLFLCVRYTPICRRIWRWMGKAGQGAAENARRRNAPSSLLLYPFVHCASWCRIQ